MLAPGSTFTIENPVFFMFVTSAHAYALTPLDVVASSGYAELEPLFSTGVTVAT